LEKFVAKAKILSRKNKGIVESLYLLIEEFSLSFDFRDQTG
jgi:hypothetical protein